MVSSGPAGAHPGATVFKVTVGRTGPVFVLVPADYGRAIDRIDITTPPAFRLDGGVAPSGWQVARSAATLTFTGGVIQPNLFELLTINGAAIARGQLIFPITTHSPDGTVMRYAGGPGAKDVGVVLYADVSPSSFPWKTVGGAAVLALGAGGTLTVIWRRRHVHP